jgi:hypothetical protein
MKKVTKMGMGAVGLLLFFAACEKEIPANIGEGKKVSILFSIEPTGYNTVDEMVRSGSVGEPVTSVIPLDDEFCLQATLAPDAEEELRGPAAFKEGQKLCFAAFLTTGTQVGSTAVYTYSGGKWTSSAPLGVTPDNVTEYRFVAYSYFDETGTPPTNGAGIDPVHDLVYGMSGNTKIEDETEAKRTVSIHMTHKFARVKVRIKSSVASANIAYLSGIAIEGGQTAGLNLFTGNITWSGSVTQDMGLSGNYSAVEVASGYRTVKPVASPTKVRIGSVRVSTNSTTFSGVLDLSTALSGAGSYNLLVEVQRTNRWAKSNIYWDGNQLTFDRTPLGHENYQGVFFKWGSLIGMSPRYETYITIYDPDSGAQNIDGSDYASIAYNNAASDICARIDNAWHIPTEAEFNVSNFSYGGGSPQSPYNASGRGGISNGATYTDSFGTVFFPASGYRFGTNISGDGMTCKYWSGGAARMLVVGAGGIATSFQSGASYPPSDACPIRCIRNN